MSAVPGGKAGLEVLAKGGIRGPYRVVGMREDLPLPTSLELHFSMCLARFFNLTTKHSPRCQRSAVVTLRVSEHRVDGEREVHTLSLCQGEMESKVSMYHRISVARVKLL